MRRCCCRAVGALAVALALSIAGVSTSGAAIPPNGGPGAARQAPAGPDGACIREGLAPIPVTVRGGATFVRGGGRPVLEVVWSGKPLAAGCEARRTVAIYFVLWFPHLRFVFTEGFPIHFLEFWNGRKAVSGERESYVSPTYGGLQCIRKARAKLRYRVEGPDGEVVARRIVSVPVKLLPCSE